VTEGRSAESHERAVGARTPRGAVVASERAYGVLLSSCTCLSLRITQFTAWSTTVTCIHTVARACLVYGRTNKHRHSRTRGATETDGRGGSVGQTDRRTDGERGTRAIARAARTRFATCRERKGRRARGERGGTGRVGRERDTHDIRRSGILSLSLSLLCASKRARVPSISFVKKRVTTRRGNATDRSTATYVRRLGRRWARRWADGPKFAPFAANRSAATEVALLSTNRLLPRATQFFFMRNSGGRHQNNRSSARRWHSRSMRGGGDGGGRGNARRAVSLPLPPSFFLPHRRAPFVATVATDFHSSRLFSAAAPRAPLPLPLSPSPLRGRGGNTRDTRSTTHYRRARGYTRGYRVRPPVGSRSDGDDENSVGLPRPPRSSHARARARAVNPRPAVLTRSILDARDKRHAASSLARAIDVAVLLTLSRRERGTARRGRLRLAREFVPARSPGTWPPDVPAKGDGTLATTHDTRARDTLSLSFFLFLLADPRAVHA